MNSPVPAPNVGHRHAGREAASGHDLFAEVECLPALDFERADELLRIRSFS